MAKKEIIKLTPDGLKLVTIMGYSGLSEINGFYQKEVFFSKYIDGDNKILFQLLGYLGAFARSEGIDKEVSIIVISDKILKDFDEGITDPFIADLENKLNQNSSPLRRMKFISETHLLTYLEMRANQSGDTLSMDLLSQYKTSKKRNRPKNITSNNLFNN